MKTIAILLFALLVILSAGCTTSTYGKTFTPVNSKPDQYTLKMYTEGFAFQEVATERLKKEADKFLATSEYSSYEIISSNFELAPPGASFVVEFKQ